MTCNLRHPMSFRHSVHPIRLALHFTKRVLHVDKITVNKGLCVGQKGGYTLKRVLYETQRVLVFCRIRPILSKHLASVTHSWRICDSFVTHSWLIRDAFLGIRDSFVTHLWLKSPIWNLKSPCILSQTSYIQIFPNISACHQKSHIHQTKSKSLTLRQNDYR